MTNYKPFDLEAAKRGEPVQTRDGRPVRIVCWDMIGDYPIVALVLENNDGDLFEDTIIYTIDGRCFSCSTSVNDLFMAPTTRKVWRVIYRDADNNAAQRDFETREAARLFWVKGAADTPFELELPS